ncbi:ribosomal protein S18-alanine N-acetyltransferase [Velocimicrobium porci]|uniref:[Ribosomal protein bS18]-alanine N-acetyltransferase n=1 Tax=Velocimicrobium porci TaxID=2606634 RepID=A0A6L5XYV4_9FIRM|nr:ribosomal protein S18-alanine N-acetyltransferase [Velocimicrobium porci]MSS63799.1 ribosomal-protein-alanine N-acetyltransferase [Velocimicrobium porci]
MEIRKMEETDIDQVEKIENEIFSMPWTRKDFMDSITNSNQLYVVAVKENEVLGYCGLWNVAGEGQITNVAVKKTVRNQKIGFQMLSYLIKWGMQEKITAFTLEVRESNKPAIHLYKKLGFRAEGLRKNFYEKPKEDAVIMWKYSEDTDINYH